MSKSYMSEVAKVLGVQLYERFIIKNKDFQETVLLGANGFYVVGSNNALGEEDCELFSKVLQGNYEIEKIPWTPKYNDVYWTMYFASDGKPFASRVVWIGDSVDFTNKALDKIYRTKEEAEKHFAEDFKKLTGKELKEQVNE